MTTGRDRPDLLEAVLKDVDDDAPRLAYAAWCDERGDPRGEFIRIQLEQTKYPAPCAASAALHSEAWRLLTAHGAEWKRPIQHLVRDVLYERGFIFWVSMTAADWLAHATDLLAAVPLRSLSVRALEGRVADFRRPQAGARTGSEFFQSEHLLRITSLEVSRGHLDDAGVAVLAGSPFVRNLRRLYLSHNPIGELGAEALAASPNLPSLETLGFEKNGVALITEEYADWNGVVVSTWTPPLQAVLRAKYGARPWLK